MPGLFAASVGRGQAHGEHEVVIAQQHREGLADQQPQQLEPTALSASISEPQMVAAALAELSRHGIPVTDFALGQPSLDEVFLSLTGRPAEDEAAIAEEEAAV